MGIMLMLLVKVRPGSDAAGLVPHAAGPVSFTAGELLRSLAELDRRPRQQVPGTGDGSS